MDIVWRRLKLRKLAGVTFTINQMWDLARRIRDVPIHDNLIASYIINGAIENGHIGLSFRFFFAPEGLDEDKEEVEKRAYMHILAVQDPEPGETIHEYPDIPLDESEPNVSKAFKWLTGLGYSAEELKARWMTVSEWAFIRDG